MTKNSSSDKKLSAKQSKAIDALLNGDSREATAMTANVHTRTLYRAGV